MVLEKLIYFSGCFHFGKCYEGGKAMKVSEAIEKLNVGDTVWVKGEVAYINKSGVLPLCIKFAERTKVFVEADEISLTEPKNEKVEVTEKQAELLRAFKGESIFELLANCLGEDEELMAKAKLFGYTVKPKRWVVKRSDGDYVNDYQEATLCVGIGLTPELDVLPPFKFTDKSKAEAVATLVEGSVEEV